MRSTAALLFLFCSVYGQAQLNHPKASPAAKVVQEVGFTTITVYYSRPAARGRKIFGDLVPYGRIWRVGANESTKITVNSDVKVLGNDLPKGTYALYAFPQEKEWEVVFHKNTSHWGDGRKNYNPEEDAFRVRVRPEVTPSFQENFLIAFDSISHNRANMVWHWANLSVQLPIEVDTKNAMEDQIAAKLKNEPSAQTYYEIARYYVEEHIKYKEALNYLNKAIDLGGDTYYFHRVKSLAEAALGDYSAAIQSAKKSLQLAEAQEKDEFVRMNRKNIDLWLEKEEK